jgi:hypothetical protein
MSTKQILLINPCKSNPRRHGKKQEKNAMAKKKPGPKPGKKRRKSTSSGAAPKRRRSSKKSTSKKRRRRNPSRVSGTAMSLLAPRNLLSYGLDATKGFGGALAAQFFAKKFAEGGGGNDPNWSWKNYLLGMGGAFSSGFVAELIKRGSGRPFIVGGLTLLLYKAWVNEVAPRSAFVDTYWGQDMLTSNNDQMQYLGYDGQYYTPGDNYLGADGEMYLLGTNGMWYPTSENYRDPDMHGALVPSSSMGGAFEPEGSLGSAQATYSNYFNRGMANSNDPYAQAFLS